MDNPETLATWGTQHKKITNQDTTQYVFDTTMRKQTQITYIRRDPFHKQLEVKTNRTSF